MTNMKTVASVSVNCVSMSSSTTSNEMGMRPMQKRPGIELFEMYAKMTIWVGGRKGV